MMKISISIQKLISAKGNLTLKDSNVLGVHLSESSYDALVQIVSESLIRNDERDVADSVKTVECSAESNLKENFEDVLIKNESDGEPLKVKRE